MNNIQINIENYEVFALDYLEDNLSVEGRRAFDQFLSTHPDIEEELSGLMDYRVERVGFTYIEKEQLKKRVGISLNGRFGLLSIAASILLMAAVFMFLNRGEHAPADMAIDNSTPGNQIELNKEKNSIDNLSKVVDPSQNEVSNFVAEGAQVIDNYDDIANKDSGNNVVNNDDVAKVNKKTPTTTSTKFDQSVNEIAVTTNTLSKKPNNKNLLNKSVNKGQFHVDEMALAIENDESSKNAPVQSHKIPSSLHQDDHAITELNQPSLEITSSDDEINRSIAHNDLDRSIVEQIPTLDLLKPNIQLSTSSSITHNKMAALSTSLPEINIPDQQHDDEALIASAVTDQEDKSKNKKLKIRFRNFLPEQFAGLTKGDIKRSLIPESFTAR